MRSARRLVDSARRCPGQFEKVLDLTRTSALNGVFSLRRMMKSCEDNSDSTSSDHDDVEKQVAKMLVERGAELDSICSDIGQG